MDSISFYLSTPLSLSEFITEGYLIQFYPENFKSDNFDRLLALLNNPVNYTEDDFDKSYCFIGPRKGTKSSWSSKVMDLVKMAGIQNIINIEKIKLVSSKNLDRNIFDPLLEDVYHNYSELNNLWHIKSSRHEKIHYIVNYSDLKKLNTSLNLALNDQELDYLITYCEQSSHQLTDVELMMFAQANSEHCRHKIFNAQWVIDGNDQEKTLFQLIKNTHKISPKNTIKAYNDNAAIVNTFASKRIWPDYKHIYQENSGTSHTVIKVETHNHPTAISPFPGAATGSGGEIRDEGATGRGAQPKAGLVGFSVSHLNIPNRKLAWEIDLPIENNYINNNSMQSALTIMLEAPLGAARYNNEFGRPNICGYFRDFCYKYNKNTYYGYHKPIMIAGGLGSISSHNTDKISFTENNLLIVLGGPALLIGLGGGAASSSNASLNKTQLDYASVQRDNPEMQRRCQEVINHCWRAINNPILSIHDVGAGGLSNAIPEIIHESHCGADLDITKIPTADPSLSPLELWSNEAQERYVLVIAESSLDVFTKYCKRENCPFAVLGKTTKNFNNNLLLADINNKTNPIDLPLDILFGNIPKIIKNIQSESIKNTKLAKDTINKLIRLEDLKIVCENILRHPTVASKQYLITIGDRSVGGLIARDQMVGKYQTPVADCGVTLNDFTNLHGEAMAIGERTPLAVINPEAAARIAIAEAITNIISADITQLEDIKLSANWMVASGENNEDLGLYNSVFSIGEEFCPKLGVSIPVGKDSMSMRTSWVSQANQDDLITVKAPVSLIISAFAPVNNVNKSLTPELKLNTNTELWLIDLNAVQVNTSLSGSIYSQITNNFNQNFNKKINNIDINPGILKNFVNCILELKNNNIILAYHDRSDGGVWATLCEMAFASQVGLDLIINNQEDINNFLFNEGIGAVLQVSSNNLNLFKQILDKYNLLRSHSYNIAKINPNLTANIINIIHNNQIVFSENYKSLQLIWSETSYHMQKLRGNPEAADQELLSIKNNQHELLCKFNFSIIPSFLNFTKKHKPIRAAILREQGTNGHIEMAAALMRAGFECVDVHMNDILLEHQSLDSFNFLAVCGGFSYGDVLGAGRGWAARILYNQFALEEFTKFFNRKDTLTLGVCNGCQMLSQLKSIIPSADHWPGFEHNDSRQFEARLVTVKISDSSSVLFKDMQNSLLPIVVSHGEGRVANDHLLDNINNTSIVMQYVDSQGQFTEHYPANPNGSIKGIAGLCSQDGRVTIMMPHPERVFRNAQLSWCPEELSCIDDSPWMRMFYNAAAYLLNSRY
ncbi:MAG: phosphoribosylformylglycinamidine synthase [Gammaproteobacteria bacterium]|nr:phosphoribosylformylglycinamidine synthase [Gammaproteobacteria bacterium]